MDLTAHKYHRFTDIVYEEDVKNKLPNQWRYFKMAFRPAGVLILCICLTVLISIPCVVVMYNTSSESGDYAVAMAILTGVIASGLVSVSIELANNYRHNRQRFVVLSEYLYMISMYEQFVEWGSHGEYEGFDDQSEIDWFQKKLKLTPRMRAVAELILDFGPVIENAVLTGKEYLSISELQTATQVVDAADRIGEIAGDVVSNHLRGREYNIYDVLEEPFRNIIRDFSEDVGIYLVDKDLESVVCDYCLTYLDQLGTISNDEEVNEIDMASRNLIVHCLWDFDQAMHKLQTYVKAEPVVYENLIPFAQRLEKMDRKFYGKYYDQMLAEKEERMKQLYEDHDNFKNEGLDSK